MKIFKKIIIIVILYNLIPITFATVSLTTPKLSALDAYIIGWIIPIAITIVLVMGILITYLLEKL